MILYLVGGFNPSEKYEFISWDDYSVPNVSGKIIQSYSSHHQPAIHRLSIDYPYIIHRLSIYYGTLSH